MRGDRLPCRAAIAALLALTSGAGYAAEPRPVHPELIANVTAIEPGKPFLLGAWFVIDAGWHIYWRNPGGSGLATEVAWKLPDGFRAGPLQWPVPERYFVKELNETDYGYTREVLLFSEITPPSTLPDNGTITIGAELLWLACGDKGVCVPGTAELGIELPIGEASGSENAARFEVAIGKVPRPPSSVVELVVVEASVGEVRAKAVAPAAFVAFDDGATAKFFPYEGPVWEVVPSSRDELSHRVVLQQGAVSHEKTAPNGVLSVRVRRGENAVAETVHIQVLASEGQSRRESLRPRRFFDRAGGRPLELLPSL